MSNSSTHESGSSSLTERLAVACDEQGTFHKGNSWKPSQRLAAQEFLELIPEKHVGVLLDMLSQPGVPPKLGLELFEKFAGRKKSEQNEIAKLYRRGGARDKTVAVTRLIRRPPPLFSYQIPCDRALRAAREYLKFAPDSHQEEVQQLVDTLKRHSAEYRAAYAAFRDEEMAR